MNALEVQFLLGTWKPTSRDGDAWVRELATFPLFAGISRRRLRKLVRDATLLELAPGETIVAGDALYVILGGRGRTRGSRTLRLGDYFGEVGVLAGPVRPATLVATRELQVMRFPRASFLRLAQREPAVTLTLLRDLGSRFRRLELERVRSLST